MDATLSVEMFFRCKIEGDVVMQMPVSDNSHTENCPSRTTAT